STHPRLPAALNGGQENSIPLPPLLLRELVKALRTIRYGAVEMVIHDGRVVHLERREKVRFEHGATEHKRG
ncbi:MAG: YezD family protein, partial [Gemmatimonadales bacterium]